MNQKKIGKNDNQLIIDTEIFYFFMTKIEVGT